MFWPSQRNRRILVCKIKLFLLRKKFYKAPITWDDGHRTKSPEYEFSDAYHFPEEAIRTLIEKMRLENNNPEVEKEFIGIPSKRALLERRNARIEESYRATKK